MPDSSLLQRLSAALGDRYRIEDEINARSAGAGLYFAKPIHAEMLFASC